MIKAIIFDMDGLMIDSERVTFECYQEILKGMNLTMDEEFYKTLLGKPLKGIYQRFYDVYGNDFPIEDVIKDVHSLMAKRFETEGVPIKTGLKSLLEYLKENNLEVEFKKLYFLEKDNAVEELNKLSNPRRNYLMPLLQIDSKGV